MLGPLLDHRSPEPDPLVNTCRQIRKLLGSAKPSAALRIAAPHVADALPLVAALVLGIEDLADRQTLMEAQFRRALAGRLHP